MLMYNNYIYIAVMALVSYTIRILPLTLIRKPIKNQFIQSFLYYVPYAVLGAMTFPDVLSSTASTWSAAAGLAMAIFMSIKEKGLLTVALSACATVYLFELVMRMF